jgi:hypothetical protein
MAKLDILILSVTKLDAVEPTETLLIVVVDISVCS